MKRTLNITNGDVFNHVLLAKISGEALPFREVMMDGETVAEIFSDDFVRLRASVLNVSAEEYRPSMAVYDALQANDYAELVLWFGKDTFCQMNLLTLLAYLEQRAYRGRVTLNYIDDETFRRLEENIEVHLGGYGEIYEAILIHREQPKDIKVLDSDAIALYFDYRSDDGALARMVRENRDKPYIALMGLLLCSSKAYGLSDVQAGKLIEKYRA